MAAYRFRLMNSYRLADVRLHHCKRNINHRFSRGCLKLDHSGVYLCSTQFKPAVQFVSFICQSSVRYLKCSSKSKQHETFVRIEPQKQKANVTNCFAFRMNWWTFINMVGLCLPQSRYLVHVSSFPLIISHWFRNSNWIRPRECPTECVMRKIQFDIYAN